MDSGPRDHHLALSNKRPRESSLSQPQNTNGTLGSLSTYVAPFSALFDLWNFDYFSFDIPCIVPKLYAVSYLCISQLGRDPNKNCLPIWSDG